MSGPKVVDVRAVRATQDRAWKVLCHRLEQELLDLKSLACSYTSESEIEAIAAFDRSICELKADYKRRSLPLLLDTILDQANAQLLFASELRSSIEQSHLEKLAEEQSRRRSRQLAVGSLASRLESSQYYEIRDQLLSNPSDENIDRALAILEQEMDRGRNNDLQGTVDAIAGKVSTFGFDQWLDSHGRREDPVIKRLDKLAASVELISGIEDVSSWKVRIAAVAQEQNDTRRRLQADSIAIQLAKEKKRLQISHERKCQLDRLEAELAAFDDVGEFQRQRVAKARFDELVDIEVLKSDIHRWCIEESKRQDQAECQNAILSVLRSLGYDVRESMATAWAQDGQVIVQDSSSQDYGVELSSLDSGGLRTQLVRFSNQNETTEKQRQRDAEVETQWCKAHSKVLETLNQMGLSSQILASRSAGSTAIKIVNSPSMNNTGFDVSSPKQMRNQRHE